MVEHACGSQQPCLVHDGLNNNFDGQCVGSQSPMTSQNHLEPHVVADEVTTAFLVDNAFISFLRWRWVGLHGCMWNHDIPMFMGDELSSMLGIT